MPSMPAPSRRRRPQKSTRSLIGCSSVPPFRLVHECLVFKNTWRQNDPCDAKSFQKPRTNSARLEDTDHFAVRPNSLFLEREDFLHADHVLFHAGDFRYTRDF